MLLTIFCFFKLSIKFKNSNITLTSNIEMNNSLSFLDIKIVRENNIFTISVYRKLTFSGVFTNFESFIPNSYKYALIFTLLHRAFKLCSNFELFHQEIENLKNIFRISVCTRLTLLIFASRNIWIICMLKKEYIC